MCSLLLQLKCVSAHCVDKEMQLSISALWKFIIRNLQKVAVNPTVPRHPAILSATLIGPASSPESCLTLPLTGTVGY